MVLSLTFGISRVKLYIAPVKRKDQVKVNTGLLQELVRRQLGLDATKVEKLPESIRLPLRNLSDLTTMKQQLHSEDTFKQSS